MMPDRRSFLRAALAGPLLLRSAPTLAQQRIEGIGLQLYTVRSELQKEFHKTLAKVAAIGYKEVEFFGYFGQSSEAVRSALRANGLSGVSSLVTFDALGDQWPGIVETARTIGHQYLVVVSIDPESQRQPGIWERAAERFNRAGEVCRAAGITFAYHNHMFEFAGGRGTTKRPYEIILESTDPALVSFEMDLCWIIAAGQDPSTYLKRYPGRFASVHVKDLKRLPPPPARMGDVPDRAAVVPDLADVGHGVIDWERLLPQCWLAGIRHYVVEHDAPSVPFTSAESGFKYLSGFTVNDAR